MGAARSKRRDRRETAGVRLHWRDLGRPRADRAATAVDVHSHAGNLIRVSHGSGSFAPVAEPMRQGGVSAICLAVVADSPIIRTMDGRLRPGRDPRPGELYDYTQRSFQQFHALAGAQQLPLLRTAADLNGARASRPSIIVSSEGGDFLEGRIERLDEAYRRWALRHLQLTHYRPNELGDIQTEPSVHGGLTQFGVEVIRRCNQLGIVVDVAHGTYELVKDRPAGGVDTGHPARSWTCHCSYGRRHRHLAGLGVFPKYRRLCRRLRAHGRRRRHQPCRPGRRPARAARWQRNAELC